MNFMRKSRTDVSAAVAGSGLALAAAASSAGIGADAATRAIGKPTLLVRSAG